MVPKTVTNNGARMSFRYFDLCNGFLIYADQIMPITDEADEEAQKTVQY